MDYSKINSETWDKVALPYHKKFKDLTLYDATYATFCGLLKLKDALLFEIGCGPGNVTKSLLTLRPDLKIDAIDTSHEMLKIAKEVNPSVIFKLMDCRTVDTVNVIYDAVLCGFCMPYLSKEECKKLILDSAAILKAGGIFYFSVIEGDYEKSSLETSSNGEHSLFVYLHEQPFFHSELIKNGFDLIEEFRIPYQKSDLIGDTHLVMIARKK